MRILMVNDHLPGAGWGAEVHLQRLIVALEAAGDEVAVFSPSQPHRGFRRALDVWDPGHRRGLRDKAASFRPDVIHFHNFQRELSAAVLGAVPGRALVLTAHDHRLFGEEDAGRIGIRAALDAVKPLKARLERSLARRLMHVATAPSMDLVERLRRDGFVEVHHVPYFVDPGPGSASPPSASREIAFVGRVSEDKGVTDLISAFERVAERHPDAGLSIAGSGDELAPIRASVPRSISERVSFLGRLDTSGVRALMEAARLICIPSRKREGSPITAIEAAFSGRPVVTSDDPGLKELVEDAGYGIVARRSDIAGLAAGLDALLRDPTEADRLGAAGRMYALEHWTTEHGVRLTRTAYERAMEVARVHPRTA